MGNTAEVTVVGDPRDFHEIAKQRLQILERQWSRFIPTSDISLLNTSHGGPTQVHRDTVKLVQYLVAARSQTNELFDPTLLPALIDLGYGTSMSDPSMTTTLSVRPPFSTPLSSTRIDEAACIIQLPTGITLDPGGLGKGLAADLVATELIEAGAHGVCVNIGGDLRCLGNGPNNGSWNIDIESPFDSAVTIVELAVHNGGVATSSTRAKRWHTQRGEFHHLLSPRTRTPLPETADAPVQVTVIGADAVWAEILSTAILVAGTADGLVLVQKLNLAAMIVLNNGDIVTNAQWKEFIRC